MKMGTGKQVYKKTGKQIVGDVRLFTCLLVSLCTCLLATACAPQLKGTDLGKERAPDFRLNDERGNMVSLADFRGRVVVLTFLYTICPVVKHDYTSCQPF